MAGHKRAVDIEAYDSEGKSVLHQIYPKHDWHEDLHPIIDSDAERARLGISRIRGKQYDNNGDVEVTWDLSYGERGEPIEEQIWRKDGSTEHTRFPEGRCFMCECSSLECLSHITLNPYVIHFTVAPLPPWIAMEGVRLCPSKARQGAPDLYGLVEQAGVRVMRLDLYRQEACTGFRDVVALWKQWLLIAYCDYIYLVSLHTNQVHAHALDGYFGSLEGLTNHLLVADACRLMCFDEEATLLWSVPLGIDGVVFAVEGEVVVGEAEIDPPGGWVPFRVALQSGKRLESEAEDRLHRRHLEEGTSPDRADHNDDGGQGV